MAEQPTIPTGQRLRGEGDDAEKWCLRCAEWWPATLEFFFASARDEGGLFYCCKACFAEWRAAHPRKAAQ